MRIARTLLLPACLVAASCGPDTDSTTLDATQLTAPLFEVRGEHFRTHATGAEEVPVRATRAQGQAQFRLSRDGTTLHYKLIVANIVDVQQAHIHVEAPGVNGPVVAFLYPATPPFGVRLIPGRTQGVLGEGDITSARLVGPLAGMTLSDLMDEIRAGNTYVNVHTEEFPGGEIRGQID